jgi:hypothetical protein
MRERLKSEGGAAQRGAARALEQAAKSAEASGDSDLAEALRREAEGLRDAASAQGAAQSGPSSKRGSAASGLEKYLDQMAERGATGKSLADQQRQMEMAQRMNGAMGHMAEGSKDGEGQGKCEGKGEGEGQGMAEGSGQPSGGKGSPGMNPWGAGTEHTDHDDPGYDTTGRSHEDMDRQVNGRRSDWTTEFGQKHAPSRLEGIDALAVAAEIPLSEGPIEQEDIRLTGGDERAQTPLLNVPSSYRRAAEEAIDGEQVPRAYRDQVKSYFDVAR